MFVNIMLFSMKGIDFYGCVILSAQFANICHVNLCYAKCFSRQYWVI